MNIAFLTYSFLFETDVYQHLFQFEDDLGKYFADKGIEARVIKPMGQGTGNKIIHLVKKPAIAPPTPSQPPKSKGNTGFTIRAKGRTNLEAKHGSA